MEQEPMDVETKVYKEVCESTLLCLISAHGYEKPLNTNDQDQKVTPLVGHCPCGDCHAKNESCPMETDNDCVSDVNDKKVLVKETQTELTWCPNYDIYSCSFVSKEDINAFKLQCLLEKLFLEKTQKVFECNGTTSQFIYNAKDVQSISEMCSAETVQQLVHHKCEVMSFCYDVVDGKIDSDRELLMACIHVLELAILHDKNVCQTVADTRQSIHLKLCLLFDNLEEDNEKQLFIRIFRNVVKQALTIDDEVFQRMVYRGCSVLSTRNEPLLLEGVLFLDAAVELYQEWDIHTMLLNNSVFPIIVSLLSHSNSEMKVKAMRMLGNLLSLVHLNINWAVIKGGIMNHLLVFLLSDDPELVKQSLWLLSNVNAGPKGSTKTMVHFGLISVVLKHMQSGCAHVAIEALYVIANLIEDASPKMRTVLLKDKEILMGLIFCLQAEKSELQPEDGDGVSYIELLRDTFSTIHKCLIPKQEDEEYKPMPSDSDSEYDETKSIDSEDDDESPKRIHYFQESEKKEVLTYLHEEHDICKHLKSLGEREYKPEHSEIQTAVQTIYKNFAELLGVEKPADSQQVEVE